MDKAIDSNALARFISLWQLEPAGEPFATHSSVLLPAWRMGAPVMLKLTREPDEIRGGALLAAWNGDGAVRVLERREGALLMERPLGSGSLVRMSLEGDDKRAVELLCSVARLLHQPPASPLPELEPLDVLFAPLLESTWDDEIVQTGRSFVRKLMRQPIDVVPLHGDLQHYNVLDAGNGRWVAIDPKGNIGERAYDFVNLFRNPTSAIATDPSVFARRLDQIVQCAGLDRVRLAKWIAGFSALCLVWDYYPEGSPDSDRALARLALETLDGANMNLRESSA